MKKMRRLIPAIAMLLVSAVMLSTASFAWFTMNTEVEVSGMEIKAKADGSLLISQAPLSAEGTSVGQPSITLSTGVKNLYPMAYNALSTNTTLKQGATLSSESADGWYVPDDNKENNIQTGLNNGDLKALTESDLTKDNTGYNKYYYAEEFYIAAADEAKTNASLQIDLTALAASTVNETWKAYAAAIYVVNKTTASGAANAYWADNTDVAYNATPDAILFADTASDTVGETTTKRDIVTLTGLTIPSVAGAVDNNTVGLKIVVHFYVDGALMSKTTTQVNAGSIYTQDNAKYSPDKAYTIVKADAVTTTLTTVDGYYIESTDASGNKVYTPATGNAVEGETYYEITTSQATPTDAIMGADAVPDTWYTAKANPVHVPYAYVRTADIPSDATELELLFNLAN